MWTSVLMLAQDNQANQPGALPAIVLVVYLAIIILMIVSMWKIFEKAGKPGWASIVPIYNMVVLLQIAGKPVWWLILMFIPFVNFIAVILILVELSKKFGQSALFAAGLILLPIVFYPYLAFGDAKYEGAGNEYDDE